MYLYGHLQVDQDQKRHWDQEPVKLSEFVVWGWDEPALRKYLVQSTFQKRVCWFLIFAVVLYHRLQLNFERVKMTETRRPMFDPEIRT
jgi:hypothetical protein